MSVIPEAALAYLAAKGLKTSWNWHEVYAAEHAHAFTVAKIMDVDILDAIFLLLQDAIATGQTFESFKRDLLKNLGEQGWGDYQQKDEKTGEVITRLSNHRLRKIYDINVNQSYHAGAWQRFQKTKQALPYLRYRVGPSIEHRHDHLKWNNIVLHVDDPWWRTHMPQNGWGCKCWVQQITAAEAELLGISQSPVIDYHEWINPDTGEAIWVPKGIDPGFEYNVGIARADKDADLLTTKQNKIRQALPQWRKR